MSKKISWNVLLFKYSPIEVIWPVLESFKCIKLLSKESSLTLKSDCFSMKTDHPLIHWSQGCLPAPQSSLTNGQSKSILCFQLHDNNQVLACRLYRAGYFIRYIYPRMLCTSLVLDASFCLQEAQWPMRKTIFSSLDFTSSLPTHSIILWNMIFVFAIQLQHLIQVISIQSPHWIACTQFSFTIFEITNHLSGLWSISCLTNSPPPWIFSASRYKINTCIFFSFVLPFISVTLY